MHQPPGKAINKQQGVALLLIMMIVIVTGSSLVLATANYQNQRQVEQIDTLQDMYYAKEALIAYALQHNANYPGQGPGRLPCPDTDNDGDAEASCNETVGQYLGRLPEFAVLPSGSRYNFSNTNTGIDQQFWYAVTPAFHMTGTAAGLNTTTNPFFTIDGVGDSDGDAYNDVVAVIFAPGEAVNGQIRVSNDADDYLEGDNQDGVNFIRNDPAIASENFNDQFVTITRNEIVTAAAMKAAMDVKDSLDGFYDDGMNYIFYISFFHPNCASAWNFFMNTYPRDNANTGMCITQTEQQGYDSALASYASAWYAGEAWDTVDSYNYVNATQATVTFTDCNIVFTINRNTGITRDRRDCNDLPRRTAVYPAPPPIPAMVRKPLWVGVHVPITSVSCPM